MTEKEIKEIKDEMQKLSNVSYLCTSTMEINDFKLTSLQFDEEGIIGTEEILVFSKLIEKYGVRICLVEQTDIDEDTEEEIINCVNNPLESLADDVSIPIKTIISISYDK